MSFFTELFKPKPAEPPGSHEPASNAAPTVERGGGLPTQQAVTSDAAFRPVSSESRKKTSRISLSLPDREIKLVLGDVIHRIPSHFLKPGPHDLQRPLLFSVHDLFADIARGRAAVPLSKIAKLCPEIFREQIGLGEDIEVTLPLQKLVTQVGAFPMDDNHPPAERPPEKMPPVEATMEKSDAGSASVSVPVEPEKPDAAAAPPNPPPFTDENISLRLAPILRTMPKEALIGELHAIDDSLRIVLPYRLIESQLSTGKVELMPNDFIDALPTEYRVHFARGATVKIPIPIEEIREAQAGGRTSETEKAEEPELASSKAETEPDKPSVEIEKPAPVLEASPTPFTTPQTTETGGEPASSPFARRVTVPPPLIRLQPQAAHPPQPILASESSASPAPFASLQAILQTNDPLDARKIAELICGFPGIAACVLIAKGKLIKAGEVPSDFDVEAFCRTSCELAQSFANCAGNLNIGPAKNLVLDCQRLTASLFSQGEACLCVLQKDRNLPPELRDKLTRILAELARVL